MSRRATRVAAGLAALALAALPARASSQAEAPAPGPAFPVSIGFAAVQPQHVDVLAGDAVTWTNDSVRTHTVTADDGSFDSGRLVPSDTFSHVFAAPGDWPYHCIIHPFIRGDVAVHRLLLSAPAPTAASDRPFPLSGRAALAPGAAVQLQADRGAGFAAVATATVAADGSFTATVVPGTTATYRAVAGGDASPPVTVVVLDRTIAVRVQRGRHRLLVRAAVTPASAGIPVVLELFLHDHLGWWPVQRGRLDRASSARFAVRTRRRVAMRVLLTLPDGATPLAVSRTVRVGPAH